MSKVFNGNMWSGIGSSINNNRAYRDQQRDNALSTFMNSALAVEKMKANSDMRDAWMDYLKGMQDSQEQQAADDIETSLDLESLISDPENQLDITPEQQLAIDYSIWNDPTAPGYDSSMVANGYDVHPTQGDKAFLDSFDPNTASREDIIAAQRLLGIDADGIWGKKSRSAYKKYKGV